MITMIVWDMDGTLADLYGVRDWLSRLRAADPTPYLEAMPLQDMSELAFLLSDLMDRGVDNRVVTWLSKGADEGYKDLVRQYKRLWLEEWGFPYDHFHGVQYGATKADSVRKYLPDGGECLLIDDDPNVRKGWTLGPAIDPTQVNVVEFLRGLLSELPDNVEQVADILDGHEGDEDMGFNPYMDYPY